MQIERLGLPGGGAPRPMGGGGPPLPGGYCVGAPAMLAPAAAAATVPLPWGVITWGDKKHAISQSNDSDGNYTSSPSLNEDAPPISFIRQQA